MNILDLFDLNDAQEQAVVAPGDVVVTAGAGSGKTRTLVARYLHHLESGFALRSIIAITFTEKAAREMRTRIREAIAGWLAQDPPDRAHGEQIFADLDAAYIGTIHSLCAQILRAHPVEAARLGVQPGFGVLEEGRSALLRARAVEEGLSWAADDEVASHLFRLFGEYGLRKALAALLKQRLDAAQLLAAVETEANPLSAWTERLLDWLAGPLEAPAWQETLADLAALGAKTPDDAMEQARQAVLAHANALEQARQRQDVAEVLHRLTALQQATSLKGRKANWPGETLAEAKNCMRWLREYFDTHLAPLADSKKPAAWTLDEQLAGLISALHATYQQTLAAYERDKGLENSLDFDDLEERTLVLLRDPSVRAFWQRRARAVLVDEFQDTNERQREIVYALVGFASQRVGESAKLFVVGDSKQSIYRFRGADVTVFRRVQQDIAQAGGQVVSLDRTFRAHQALVAETNRLMAPIMGEEEQPSRPYLIPFTPLEAHRETPRPGVAAPFIELHIGLGANAAEGRQAAAEGLAARLHQLHAEEEIQWSDVALLFRASTAFPVYEAALEQAGIPFVTVAGRGFYDRPEVRDLLNALRAIADPTDDLALMGLLCSPAIGLSDAALYTLRFPRASSQPASLWLTLRHPTLPNLLQGDDLARAIQARELVEELNGLVGRVSVAALLKRLLDRTHYRAALDLSGGVRALRNVDKLLADAHLSGLVSVFEFDEYVRALRDVGARESEAPTEAGQAVQLMTVHKAKGLEFPVIVIAAAAYTSPGRPPALLLDDELGVTVDLTDGDGHHPVMHRLATQRNREQEEAESHRLLYVAATRAQEKLLVSGHAKTLKSGRLSLKGWLGQMGAAIGLSEVTLDDTPTRPRAIPLSASVHCMLYPLAEAQQDGRIQDLLQSPSKGPIVTDMVAPLVMPTSPDKLRQQEAWTPPRVWRVVPTAHRPEGPAWVVGHLVHAALRRWRFPTQPDLESFLRPFALEAGLTNEKEIHNTIASARGILARFQRHPLYAALDRAERHHELPYTLTIAGVIRNGIVDLLARMEDGWTVIEFKTDKLPTGTDLAAHRRAKRYKKQVEEYVQAVEALLGQRPRALLVYLNVGRRIEWLTFDDDAS